MSDDQVIDFEEAKRPYAFQRREKKADAIRSKFAAARNMNAKPVKKRRTKSKKKKK